jgi:predicted dehydrogenase
MAGSGPLRIVIVGCGNISQSYAATITPHSDTITMLGAFDLDRTRAQALTQKHGGRVYDSLDAVLADPQVEAVVNLTIHQAHVEVVTRCLEAHRHVLTEKPIALDPADAQRLVALARQRGVRLAAAPITFLGEAQQTAMKLVRGGALGTVRAAYAEMNWNRIEDWHPNPVPFYEVGALYDVGVYPLTVLCATLGPVRRVSGMGRVVCPDRTAKSGEKFRVDVPDWMCGLVEFASGPVARLTCSFWVGPSKQHGIEFHGDDATLHLHHAHDFASPLQLRQRHGNDWIDQPLVKEPYRGVEWARGLIELRDAIRNDRPHRTAGEMAAHVVEVIAGIHASARTHQPVPITSSFDVPPPMPWAE